MRLCCILISLLCVLLAAVTACAENVDLRKDYGTSSLEAAQQIAKAIASADANPRAALQAIDAAIKADPACSMAFYWRGTIQETLGNIEECTAAFQQAILLDTRRTVVGVDAAINLGILNGKLKRFDESCHWFSQAIIRDPNNRYDLKGKAYRNLAITLYNGGKFTAAAIALLFAAEAKPELVPEKMLEDFLKKADADETARILPLRYTPPTLSPRTAETELTPVALNDLNVPERIDQLLADPRGRYIIALPYKMSGYYLLDTHGEQPALSKIALANPAACACLTRGQLYLALENPPRLEQVEIATGKTLATYSLNNQLPRSIAVFPEQRLAYFPGTKTIAGVNLATGNGFTTEIPGRYVAAHPTAPVLFSMVVDDDNGAGTIFNGSMMGFPMRGTSWLQTTLFKSLVVPDGLLLAEFRANVASNGYAITPSPDGKWVALPGGGGWRPAAPQAKAGYGIPIFSADNLETVQGFFPTDAYPKAAAVNPVTGHLAAVRTTDIKVYHLTDPTKCVTLRPGRQEEFARAVAWSGNGAYLAAAYAKTGFTLFRNRLLPAEQEYAAAWWKALTPETPTPTATVQEAAPPFAPAAEFAVKNDRRAAAAMMNTALAEGRTTTPLAWKQYAPYLDGEGVRETLIAAADGIRDTKQRGVLIFQLRDALRTNPRATPGKYLLAEGLCQIGETDEAMRYYLEAIRDDAGRTELAGLALHGLAALTQAHDDRLGALYCLAMALCLDRVNPDTVQAIIPLLRELKYDEELKRLQATIPVMTAPAGGVPKIDLPAGGEKTVSAPELFQAVAESVVRIQAGNANGSGVCIGQADLILTNAHVVAGGPVWVYPFAFKDGKLTALPKAAADVIYRAEEEDLAVLRLRAALPGLHPLAVANAPVKVGEKVYAIGSPGLGAQILAQSISEGIIAAAERTLDGHRYLQHTAAVNPGNSGGPLFNERCQVIGLITLKATLENVSFAIPAEKIRALFR